MTKQLRKMIRILHTIWRQVPRDLRKKIITNQGLALSAARTLKNRKLKSGPITVAGLLRSTTGLGEGARLCLNAFEQSDIEVRHKDLGQWFNWLQTIDVELGQESHSDLGGTLIIHINPIELSVALPLLGSAFLKHKRVIGYWAWELSYLPPEWRRAISFVDEIWVPSEFVAESIRPYAKNKVFVVPHPVQRPEPSNVGRAHFGIPENAFTALTMFDLRSCASRKNPYDAIRAFRKAFSDRTDVCLVIKINTPGESPAVMKAIEAEVQGAENIKLIFDVLSPGDQAALINSVDTLISLHRSEGFGLALAEAMALGKPVIATGYSGNMEFMNNENSILIDHVLTPIQDPQDIYNFPNARWAQPDIEQAASWLARLESDQQLVSDIGGRAEESITKQLDSQKYRQFANSRIESLSNTERQAECQ